MRTSPWSLAVVACALATPLYAQTVPSYEETACQTPSPPGAACGTLTVWEDRDAAEGRTLGLNVMVLSATGDDPHPDPIYVLTGGPGSAATGAAGNWGESPFRATRDIVMMDQRGTGRSNVLDCQHPDDADVDAFLGQIFDPDLIASCVPGLETHADLTQYQSPFSLDDLEDLRQALGHEQINLWGTSYGTRASLVYLRRHGEHVRTAVLNASMSMSQIMPDGMARDAEASIRGVIEDCMAMPDCAARYPNLEADYASAVEGARQPVAVTVRDPRSDAMVEATMQPAGFGESLRAMLYNPGATRDVPRLLHVAATTGNYDGFASFGAQRTWGIARAASTGLYLSITCAEDIPFANEAGESEQAAGTFLADSRARSHHDSCRRWPRGRVSDDFHAEVVSDAPVLILSGTHDPVTPPRWGAAAASALSNAIHVIVPHGHHGWGGLENAGDCVRSIQEQFLANPTGSPDVECLKTIRRQPFN